MGVSGGMEADEEAKNKKINEDVMVFLRKRSETNAPRYTARLKTYVDLQHKRRRAATARRRSEQILKNDRSTVRKKNEENKNLESAEVRGADKDGKHRDGKRRERRIEKPNKIRSCSRSRSPEPVDGCGRRRRRRRRRKSCRRRRSCSRRRRRRRRRRSCSRRRRRRSCRRRQRRRRRRRRC